MGGLPTGTVTFLFTDIQGSTPLWEQMPEVMRPAVALHHSLLRHAIETNGGVVFKIIGDAFQAAFPLASQALSAAILAQLDLQSAEWPDRTGQLKVRMGLHTGTAEIESSPGSADARDGYDYAVSHTLNRVARIMTAGHGGQILLSREAADLVERDLPPEVTLKDLGEYYLKGMARLEHIFQICAPGLQDVFPPLESSAPASGIAVPNNLPAQLTSFIGREAALEAIQRLVTDSAARLVTLTGPGGTGKTRLALQAAANLLNTFPDGIWLVELAPLADPALVPLTVADALSLHETPGRTITQKLIEHLSTRHVMLILDNCEHLVEATAGLAGQLLQTCPHLQILATSRELLGTMGETPFRVPSLALPGSRDSSLEDLARCESIRLFVERARTTIQAFSLTETNAPVVARICQRLDGIPLAIELAAARVRLLSVEQIAARLDDSFRLLTGGSRTVLSRHQTLRALIDWSYNLLTLAERVLFMRLSVFAGGCTLEAAEQVCADLRLAGAGSPEDSAPGAVILDMDSILDLLSQLVDKSLVIPVEVPVGSTTPEIGTETRYGMLETIRQYARDKLHDLGGGPSVRDRHLAYFLLLAEEAEPYLRRGDQVAWLDRLDAELDNVRLALEWSLAGGVDEGLRLSAALLWFWHIRGHGSEAVEWMQQLLVAGQWRDGENVLSNRRLTRARALIAAGFLMRFQRQPEKSLPLFEQAILLLRELGNAGRRWLGVALLYITEALPDRSQRSRYLEEALPLLREAGDPLYLAEYWMYLGSLLIEENKIDQATAAYSESLSLREQAQDLDGVGIVALSLGDVALFRRDYAECERQYEKSLACFQENKNRSMEAYLFSRLGNIELLTGNFSRAASHFEAGIALNQQTGDRQGMIFSLFDMGRMAFNINDYSRATRNFTEIARIGAEIGLKQAVLVGLIFQGLVAMAIGDTQQAEDITRQSIDYWRGVDPGTFETGFIALYLENLALLLVGRDPELAARLFSAIDRSGLVTHEINTAIEIAAFENARASARQALSEKRFAAIQADSERLTVEQALALVFEGEHPAG